MAVAIVVVVLGLLVLAAASDLRDRRARGRVPRIGNISADLREKRRDARARRTIHYRGTKDE